MHQMLSQKRFRCQDKTCQSGFHGNSWIPCNCLLKKWCLSLQELADRRTLNHIPATPPVCVRSGDFQLDTLLCIFLKTSLSADANNSNQTKSDRITDAHD